MAYFISIDLKERGISIHMQISGRIFCNLADLCRLLFATCNDKQVISKSITLPTTTLTLLQCHVVCILQTRHSWGNGDGQLSLLFVPNAMFNKLNDDGKISICVAMPPTKVQVIADSSNSVGSFTNTQSTNHYVY